MRTLVHLSDLHFDRVNPDVVRRLAQEVPRLEPDLIVVSGDFTQRARSHQFRAARAFLDTLPGLKIVVPGNHDVPLHDVVRRFFSPLGRYRRHICADLRPSYSDAEVLVLGTDTTRSLTIGGGGMRRRELARIARVLKEAAPSVVKVVVAHHPFDVPYAGAPFEGAPQGRDAVERLALAGADLFLTGHLHVSYAGPTAIRYRAGGRSAIVVEAGTATSTRMRGETNAFNVVRIERSAIAVEHLAWQPSSGSFEPATVQRFTRSDDGWALDV